MTSIPEMPRIPTRKCACGGDIYTKARRCNPCAREISAKRRAEVLAQGGSKQDAYNYEWRMKNPAAYILQNAKGRAKKKGWVFDLNVEDIVIPETCPVLGIPLFIRIGGNGQNDNSPSLDRIDSTKGYIKGNIQVISWRANHLKSDGVLEEFIKLVEFMKNAS